MFSGGFRYEGGEGRKKGGCFIFVSFYWCLMQVVSNGYLHDEHIGRFWLRFLYDILRKEGNRQKAGINSCFGKHK